MPAIVLHWLAAILIVAGFGLGLTMVDMRLSPTKLRYFSWHKWIGITVLLLAGLRLLWRLLHRPPELPATMPPWQRTASHWSHWALYLLMFAVPLSGWAYTSAAGVPVVYLGWLPLPDIAPVDKELAEQLKTLHHTLDWTLSGVVLLHVAAALKHHFLDRDGVLLRMLPFFRRDPALPDGRSK
jgi:cytochrome b561